MLDHHEAMGRVAAAALENGNRIINSKSDTAENPVLYITVMTRMGNVTIAGTANQGYFQAIHELRWSNVDGFNPEKLPHITDAQEFVQNQEYQPIDGAIELTKYEPDDDPIEYFDGIKVKHMLYPYESDFGLKQYRKATNVVVDRADKILADVGSEFEIEMDANEAADTAGEEMQDEPNLRHIQ